MSRAIAHELLHIRSADTPDGAPAVPYLVFLVRPDGIRPYYEARTCLEPLGIAFGYELIEQELAVDIPDFDNLTTWDGSVPLDMPLAPAPPARSTIAMLASDDRNRENSSSRSLAPQDSNRGPSGGGGDASLRRGQQAGTGSSTSDGYLAR